MRTSEVDVIRLAALIGICIVNVPFMALPIEAIFEPAIGSSNKVAAFIIEAFFQLKFFILFSFIFGWGVSIQQKSALTKGISFNRNFIRRMLALIFLGVLHAIFVFSGDILFIYGLIGMLLWLMRDWTAKSLMGFAVILLPVSMLILMVLIIGTEEMANDVGSKSIATLGGSYLEATSYRLEDWPTTLVILLILQGPIVLASFTAGLAAGKSDFFQEGSLSFIKLSRKVPWLLMIGLPLNILYALTIGGYISENNELLMLFTLVGIAVGAPALSAVYLVALVKLARLISLPEIFKRAGQNSLSVYVTQGVIAGIVFGGYGFGWFNQYDQFGLLIIALLVALFSILLIGIYAKYFGRGPLEPILRKLSKG